MSSRDGGRRGGRGGRSGDAQFERDVQHPPSNRGCGRGRDAPPPHHQERTSRDVIDLPESSATRLSRELEEQLHTGGSSGHQALSKALVRPLRPGFGTAGFKCKVRANHFLARAADRRNVSQYEFKIHPEVKSRSIGRALMKKLIEQFGESHLGRCMPAYDGRNIFYTAGSLPFESKEFELVLLDRVGRDKTFVVSISFAKAFDLYPLWQFLNGEPRECPYDIITSLDVVLRESPSNNYVTISRSFFSPEFGSNKIGQGLECWRGYFQSVRPTQMGLSLNFDISETSFYSPVNLLDFVSENLGFAPSVLTERQRLQVQKALKGVRVEATHMGNVRRRYKITGITSQSASQLTFTLDEQGGAAMSVAQYFREKYNYSLMHDSLPCIKAGSDNKPKYLPMEVCKIVDGQRFIKKLNDRQVTQILRSTCQRPADREKNILQLVKKNNYNNDKYAKNFGIMVEPTLTTVEARVLPAPRLKYPDSMCEPSFGQWKMTDKRMYEGGTVDAWACISFCRHSSVTTVEKFCRDLVKTCNGLGMAFNQNPVGIYFRSPSQIENSLRELYHQSVEALKRLNQKHKNLQLLIVVLPDIKGSYGRIKTICETELGLVTQCCQSKHLLNPNIQYLQNLALKINVKVEIRSEGLRDMAYRTKIIKFLGRSTPIVLQNTNGPSLLLAICNVLLLRDELDLNLEIESVSEEKLLSLLREKMFCQTSAEFREKMGDVIGLLDHLPSGIFVNPRFRKIDDFENMSEKIIFDLLEINLYHGWIVDPEDIQTAQAIGSLSYNSITARLVPFLTTKKDPSDISTSENVALDVPSPKCSSNQIGRGDWEEHKELLRVLRQSKVETTFPIVDSDEKPEVNLPYPVVQIEAESYSPSLSRSVETEASDIVSMEDQSSRKTCSEDISAFQLCQTPKNDVQDRCIANCSVQATPTEGALVQTFLSKNASQLTDHGLKCLHEGVQDMELCILFRNNHFSTMIKYREGIYLLVSDQGYIDDSHVVWEMLSL